MQVILDTDHHLAATDELAARVGADVAAEIDRFDDRVKPAQSE